MQSVHAEPSLPLPAGDGAIAAETELAQARIEVSEAHDQTEYLSKQWAEMHADLLTERNLHEVTFPVAIFESK